jgi:hypothetical protein
MKLHRVGVSRISYYVSQGSGQPRGIRRLTLGLVTTCFFLTCVLVACTEEEPFTPENRAPDAPTNPSPANNQTVAINAVLSWEASDPDGDAVTFDVYFGGAADPPLVESNHNDTTYDPGTLDFSKTYRWRIVVKDDSDSSASGPVWSFATVNNQPPSVFDPSPADDSINQNASGIQLLWDASDPEGDPLTFDVLLDVSDPPSTVVATDLTTKTYNTGGLQQGADYYWRIRVKDTFANSVEGDVWSFTTLGPLALTLAGTEDTPGMAHRVAVAGDYAYVADSRGGIQVIDIRDPTDPTRVGEYDFETGTLDIAFDIAIQGDNAFIAYGSQGLVAIDITNKNAPSFVGNLTGMFAQGLDVEGNLAYVASGNNGLDIIDISTPSSPTVKGNHTPTPDPGFARNVVVSGRVAYMVNENGLWIIGAATPKILVLLGSYTTRGDAWDVDVIIGDSRGKSYAFVADDERGLLVLDITDAASPIRLDGFGTGGGAARGIVVDGNHAYVANGTAGLQVINISVRDSLWLDGFYDTPDEATGVAVSGDYVFVADQLSGLQILDRSQLVAPKP